MARDDDRDDGPGLIYGTGLWLNEAKKTGKKYMSGNLGGVRVMIFKAKEKKNDKSPDYHLMFGENKRTDKREDETPEEDDDIPF